MSAKRVKRVRFRTPGYIFGDAMSETNIAVSCPMKIKKAILRVAMGKELSVSRYALGLIINDLLKKDEDFKEWYEDRERDFLA